MRGSFKKDGHCDYCDYSSITSSHDPTPYNRSTMPLKHMTTPADLSISQSQANDPGEDRFSIRVTPSVQAFAVYDGHGGYLACDLAASLLLDMIIADMESDDDLLTNHRYDDRTTVFLFPDSPSLHSPVSLFLIP